VKRFSSSFFFHILTFNCIHSGYKGITNALVIYERPHKHGRWRAPQGSLTFPNQLRYTFLRHKNNHKTYICHGNICGTKKAVLSASLLSQGKHKTGYC